MDEYATCGQRVEVFETPVIINARSSVAPGNPPQHCQLVLETTSRDQTYRLQIIIKSVAIKDSSFVLQIYDGEGAYDLLRQIGASSKSTDIIYTKSSFATIILTRPIDVTYSENDFTLEVKGYRDPDEGEPVVGGSRLKPGAIVGIILAILLLIGFAVVLCYMYNTGILNKKRHVGSANQSVVSSKESLNKPASSVSSTSSRKGILGKEDAAFASAFLKSVTTKLPNNGSLSRSGSGKGSYQPRMPPSRAEVKTFSEKDVYEEPISTRRNGKTSSVTFDTRQQGPQFFQRSYTSGPQNGQRSPKSSLAKSKYGVPERCSGHSNASYAEIKDLPDLLHNSRDQETTFTRGSSSQIQRERSLSTALSSESQKSSKKSSQSPRSSLHSTSKDTGNGLTSEGSSQGSLRSESAEKKQHANLLQEIKDFGSNRRETMPNSDLSPKENGKVCGSKNDYTYSIVNKKPKASESSTGTSSDFKIVPEAVITMPSSNEKQGGAPFSLGSPSEQESKPNSIDEDEDENDREVRNIHARTTSLNNDDEFSIGNSYIPEKDKPDVPPVMTNPLVNNAYIRNSINDPSVQRKNAENTNLSGQKHHGKPTPQRRPESRGSTSSHPHYGIPDLVENTPQIPMNDYGFPSAFNAILSRTVKPDPNKTIEYGYHTQTDDANESVSGKAAWYIESAPTKSGPIKTSAFFLQTSQPTQENERVYQNEYSHDPTNQPMTANGKQFGPGHTSTPVNTFQPGGRAIKPKAKPRKHSTTLENSKDRFPLSIPQTESGLSKATPGQKSAVVKSGFDPSTGCQTTQVLWTDSIPDRTDPDPSVDNPCITRKTINRITTRSTYGNLPENPFPLLNQIQMESNEPSFLSPSVVNQPHMLPSSDEISFYTQPSNDRQKMPVIHEGNQKHSNIKDRITVT